MQCSADYRNAMLWASNLSRDLSKSRNFAYLLLFAIVVTLVVGLLLFLIDPNVKSLWDGVWSAWVTMTHVGFGDVVPVSFFGRLLAAGLILLGLVLFSLFTALVSVTLIGRNMDVLGGSVRHIEREATTIEGGEDRILAEVARLHERMAALERSLVSRAEDTGRIL